MARMHARTSHHTPSHQAPEASARDGARSPRNGPTHEQIARRAYELFLSRGGSHGRHEDDWIQAERELRLGR